MSKGKADRVVRRVERALLITDDIALRQALRRVVQALFRCEVFVASRARVHTRARLEFDLVIADVGFFEPGAIKLVEELIHAQPRPLVVVVSGNSTPRVAFELGRLGVEGFLQKPFTMTELRDAVEGAWTRTPPLELLGRSWVGRVELREAQTQLREAMVEQALKVSEGNLSRAARLLAVSRQAVQKLRRTQRGGPT